MSTEIIKKAEIINKALLENEIVVRFLWFKKKLQENKRLNDIKKEQLQSQILYCKSKDESYKEHYLNLEKKYNNNPLIIQFNKVNLELINLLNNISDIIS